MRLGLGEAETSLVSVLRILLAACFWQACMHFRSGGQRFIVPARANASARWCSLACLEPPGFAVAFANLSAKGRAVEGRTRTRRSGKHLT